MRRFWTLLMAVAVAMVVALPAGAGQPDFCVDPNSTHPTCAGDTSDEEPMVFNDSCYAHGEWHKTPVSGNFEVMLGGRETGYPGGYCIDVLTGPGDWLVEIETIGRVQSLNLFLRDSVGAGDGCFTDSDGIDSCGYMFRSNDIPTEQTFTSMPGAWANACGVEWGEHVGSAWAGEEFVPGEWFDDEDMGADSPLAFLPGILAGKDATVKLTVYLPDADGSPDLGSTPELIEFP